MTMTRPEAGGMPFGGIMVSSDVTVETTSAGKMAGESVMEFAEGVGTSAYTENAGHEVVTYVDELYAMAVQKWQQR